MFKGHPKGARERGHFCPASESNTNSSEASANSSHPWKWIFMVAFCIFSVEGCFSYPDEFPCFFSVKIQIDQSKQEPKQSEFPHLVSQGSWGTKNTHVKAAPVASLGRQKSVGGRPAEHSLSSSPATTQSSVKGKRDTMSKHSEAMEFRAWCESESVRLVRAKRIDVHFSSFSLTFICENFDFHQNTF